MEKPNIDPQSVDLLNLSTHQSPTLYTSAAATIDSHALLGDEEKSLFSTKANSINCAKQNQAN